MFRRFLREGGGSVLPTFAILAIPLIVATGAVVDYNRSYDQRTVVQDSMDAAALAAGKQLGVMNSTQLTSLASSFFTANVGSKVDKIPALTTAVTTNTVKLTTQLHVPTVFLGLIGLKEFVFDLTSQTTVNTTRLRVALVLDNTGSMSSSNKLTALKTATKNLITQLKGIVTKDGDVYVSIIPFVKEVNVGTYTSSWDSWLDWNTLTEDTTNYPVPGTSVGPGSTCPWSSSSYSGTTYKCVTQPGGSTTTSSVPSSGTYKGYICPKGAALNGCYTSVASTSTSTVTVGTGWSASCSGYSSCTCTGSGSSKVCKATVTTTSYSHVWTVDKTQWTGCVSDRGGSSGPGTSSGPDQKYYATTTATYADSTAFPVDDYSSCPQAMMGLSYDWTALTTKVDNMTASGATNQPIGLIWGWQSLVGGGPLTAPALDSNYKYQQIIILLSDGLNTQDRWYGDGMNTSTDVDKRMYYKNGAGTVSGTCANVKASGITIYAVQVNTGGDPTSTLLQNCATDSAKFYELKSSDDIVTTFNTIGTEISQLRIEL